MKDALGDRMKNFYENRHRYYLSRKNYVVIRIDGKAFHTYTKGLQRPFDDGLINDMNETAKVLCEKIQGAKFAYVQSDEISILITDFDDSSNNKETEAWFDNNLQKMCSVSASIATSAFNKLRMQRFQDFNFKDANFDSRVFEIPKRSEIINYFIYRQNDATRNSVSAVAQSKFSHKQLNGKSTNEMQQMLFSSYGINWSDFEPKYKRGRGILRSKMDVRVPQDIVAKATKNFTQEPGVHLNWKQKVLAATAAPDSNEYYVTRNAWSVVDVPIFSKEREFFNNVIPANY